MNAGNIPPRTNLSPDETLRIRRYISHRVSQYGLHDYCDVDEIFQEVELAFCLAIRRRDGGLIEYRTAFLKQIAYRHIIKILNHKRKQQEIVQNLGNQYSDSWKDSDILDQIYQSDLIREARAQLTDQENELVELRIMQGMAWADICRHYRDRGETWPPDTLRQRYSRIKLKLKKHLIKRGISSSGI
jgi:DNA-directed RNA polymerase specialized sigma24 family protein